ncbi:hypothetical protein HPB51_002113 [Rhipicephalus microplus]|uniref:Uncharacterized protein n=1 Tax=Rhipicephalus microplus TaxID=6941 RepID=A0A9J6E6F4_RHIMP|nr:hypothetical protein HPB51_002113 [Rhipicephalus microplus]
MHGFNGTRSFFQQLMLFRSWTYRRSAVCRYGTVIFYRDSGFGILKFPAPAAAFPVEAEMLKARVLRLGFTIKNPSSDQLTEEDVENKFTTLSLGFKTDRLTLTKRLELHQRHRDIAEGNIQAELNAIRDLAQEERMSRAFEVMVAHVENLKRSSEREHRELEEARKLLLDHQLMHDAANVTPVKVRRSSNRKRAITWRKQTRDLIVPTAALLSLRRFVTCSHPRDWNLPHVRCCSERPAPEVVCGYRIGSLPACPYWLGS